MIDVRVKNFSPLIKDTQDSDSWGFFILHIVHGVGKRHRLSKCFELVQ